MNKQEVITLNGKELLFREISTKDKDKVMDLYKNCNDFFELTEGIKPDNCEELFNDVPPNKTIEDKFLYGIFDKDILVGVIDIVADFPEKGEWIIGLLLLSPSVRGIGLGNKIHDLIKEMVENEGGEKLRVGVIEENTKALIFWGKIGYKQIKITEPRKFGMKKSRVIVMNYYL